MGFLIRAASKLLGDTQAHLAATCSSSRRYGRNREARPVSWGDGRLQSDHCKQNFINYKWTGSPELLELCMSHILAQVVVVCFCFFFSS